MPDLDLLSWQVLNATADDCENLEQIYGQIGAEPSAQAWKGSVLLGEVAERLVRLVQDGLLDIEMDENGRPWADRNNLCYVWRAWFRMTAAGRSVWQESEHAHLV